MKATTLPELIQTGQSGAFFPGCLSLAFIHTLEVGGVSPFVKPPTGKSFRFVRACERARRGEAVWASERRFDCVARAVVRAVYLLLLWRNHAGWVVHEKC